MPKEKRQNRFKSSSSSSSHNKLRHDPLGKVIQEDELRGKYATQKFRKLNDKDDDNEQENEEEPFMDERTSRKILQMSREQQLEEDAEEMKERFQTKNDNNTNNKNNKNQSHGGVDSSDEEDEDEEESIFMENNNEFETMEINRDAGYVTVHGEGLTPEEEAVVASMMGGRKSEERRTLADMILDKISEKEQQQQEQQQQQNLNDTQENDDNDYSSLPPKVIEVYTDIGKILSRYTAGKLPKAFKVIPSLTNWEEILYLTRPDLWTPNAMYAATRIFASNLNPKMAQRFYNLVLLDSVRADIVSNHRLNYHYYMALKKAVYKPAAFFKGILLPLCKDNCTLREAAIVSSVLQRVSIPVHHSAVAIHKLAQMKEYSGAASIFLKTLLNKKYSLPAPVIQSMVRHFGSFLDQRKDNKNLVLPVLWHQCLLVFVQRYKNELRQDAKEVLRQVMRIHLHPKITPEIRRELFGLTAWKEERVTMGMEM